MFITIKNNLENFPSILEQVDATVHRIQPGRKTISFVYHDQTYFAKIHTGVGWKEIFKNIFQLRWPVLGARTEWNALLKLRALGIDAPIPVAFGSKGIHPARLKSFIVMRGLMDTINLEDYFRSEGSVHFALKHYLIKTVAKMARTLHENGMNHRDFYLCHFLVDKKSLHQPNPTVYLIDLHRAQIRSKIPLRWRVKDIGGLYFSTMDLPFTQRDYLRFMQTYTQKSLRRMLNENQFFWRWVVRRGKRLKAKL